MAPTLRSSKRVPLKGEDETTTHIAATPHRRLPRAVAADSPAAKAATTPGTTRSTRMSTRQPSATPARPQDTPTPARAQATPRPMATPARRGRLPRASVGHSVMISDLASTTTEEAFENGNRSKAKGKANAKTKPAATPSRRSARIQSSPAKKSIAASSEESDLDPIASLAPTSTRSSRSAVRSRSRPHTTTTDSGSSVAGDAHTTTVNVTTTTIPLADTPSVRRQIKRRRNDSDDLVDAPAAKRPSPPRHTTLLAESQASKTEVTASLTKLFLESSPGATSRHRTESASTIVPPLEAISEASSEAGQSPVSTDANVNVDADEDAGDLWLDNLSDHGDATRSASFLMGQRASSDTRQSSDVDAAEKKQTTQHRQSLGGEPRRLHQDDNEQEESTREASPVERVQRFSPLVFATLQEPRGSSDDEDAAGNAADSESEAETQSQDEPVQSPAAADFPTSDLDKDQRPPVRQPEADPVSAVVPAPQQTSRSFVAPVDLSSDASSPIIPRSMFASSYMRRDEDLSMIFPDSIHVDTSLPLVPRSEFGATTNLAINRTLESLKRDREEAAAAVATASAMASAAKSLRRSSSGSSTRRLAVVTEENEHEEKHDRDNGAVLESTVPTASTSIFRVPPLPLFGNSAPVVSTVNDSAATGAALQFSSPVLSRTLTPVARKPLSLTKQLLTREALKADQVPVSTESQDRNPEHDQPAHPLLSSGARRKAQRLLDPEPEQEYVEEESTTPTTAPRGYVFAGFSGVKAAVKLMAETPSKPPVPSHASSFVQKLAPVTEPESEIAEQEFGQAEPQSEAFELQSEPPVMMHSELSVEPASELPVELQVQSSRDSESVSDDNEHAIFAYSRHSIHGHVRGQYENAKAETLQQDVSQPLPAVSEPVDAERDQQYEEEGDYQNNVESDVRSEDQHYQENVHSQDEQHYESQGDGEVEQNYEENEANVEQIYRQESELEEEPQDGYPEAEEYAQHYMENYAPKYVTPAAQESSHRQSSEDREELLSSAVRAGRALQSITSDQSSPLDQAVIESPFQSVSSHSNHQSFDSSAKIDAPPPPPLSSQSRLSFSGLPDFTSPAVPAQGNSIFKAASTVNAGASRRGGRVHHVASLSPSTASPEKPAAVSFLVAQEELVGDVSWTTDPSQSVQRMKSTLTTNKEPSRLSTMVRAVDDQDGNEDGHDEDLWAIEADRSSDGTLQKRSDSSLMSSEKNVSTAQKGGNKRSREDDEADASPRPQKMVITESSSSEIEAQNEAESEAESVLPSSPSPVGRTSLATSGSGNGSGSTIADKRSGSFLGSRTSLGTRSFSGSGSGTGFGLGSRPGSGSVTQAARRYSSAINSANSSANSSISANATANSRASKSHMQQVQQHEQGSPAGSDRGYRRFQPVIGRNSGFVSKNGSGNSPVAATKTAFLRRKLEEARRELQALEAEENTNSDSDGANRGQQYQVPVEQQWRKSPFSGSELGSPAPLMRKPGVAVAVAGAGAGALEGGADAGAKAEAAAADSTVDTAGPEQNGRFNLSTFFSSPLSLPFSSARKAATATAVAAATTKTTTTTTSQNRLSQDSRRSSRLGSNPPIDSPLRSRSKSRSHSNSRRSPSKSAEPEPVLSSPLRGLYRSSMFPLSSQRNSTSSHTSQYRPASAARVTEPSPSPSPSPASESESEQDGDEYYQDKANLDDENNHPNSFYHSMAHTVDQSHLNGAAKLEVDISAPQEHNLPLAQSIEISETDPDTQSDAAVASEDGIQENHRDSIPNGVQPSLGAPANRPAFLSSANISANTNTHTRTPPQMQLSRDDITRWREETSKVMETSPQEMRPLPRPGFPHPPNRAKSPPKSCLRSPLKAHMPGRVVEFNSTALSPMEQQRIRLERSRARAAAAALEKQQQDEQQQSTGSSTLVALERDEVSDSRTPRERTASDAFPSEDTPNKRRRTGIEPPITLAPPPTAFVHQPMATDDEDDLSYVHAETEEDDSEMSADEDATGDQEVRAADQKTDSSKPSLSQEPAKPKSRLASLFTPLLSRHTQPQSQSQQQSEHFDEFSQQTSATASYHFLEPRSSSRRSVSGPASEYDATGEDYDALENDDTILTDDSGVSSSPTVILPPQLNLSRTVWTDAHWSRLKYLVNIRRTRLFYFNTRYHRPSADAHLIGQSVSGAGQTLVLTQEHADAIDAFMSDVPGWDVYDVAKRVFGVVKAEELRQKEWLAHQERQRRGEITDDNNGDDAAGEEENVPLENVFVRADSGASEGITRMSMAWWRSWLPFL